MLLLAGAASFPYLTRAFKNLKFNSETIAAGYQGPTTGSFIISCASLISPTGTRIYLSNLHDFSRTSALTLPTNGASLSAAKPIKGFSWETLQDQMALQVSFSALSSLQMLFQEKTAISIGRNIPTSASACIVSYCIVLSHLFPFLI